MGSFLFIEQLLVLDLVAGESGVQAIEFLDVLGAAKDGIQRIEEFISRGPLNRPVRRKVFFHSEYLFHHEVLVGADPISKSLQILQGIVQTIDVINAQTGESPFLHELENESVAAFKHFRDFNPQRNELVDVKETSVIDFFACDLPK